MPEIPLTDSYYRHCEVYDSTMCLKRKNITLAADSLIYKYLCWHTHSQNWQLWNLYNFMWTKTCHWCAPLVVRRQMIGHQYMTDPYMTSDRCIGWVTANRLINITLHIHIRVHLWLAISCIMTCIMIVSHTNRLDNFSQSPCTVPSCRLVGWLNRFIYRANIARAPKLATPTG